MRVHPIERLDVGAVPEEHRRFQEWREAMLKVEGMWKRRQDLPDLAALRRSWDRWRQSLDVPGRAGNHLGMQYRVLIETDEDGMFIAECPALPGCISQGKTREEAIANIKDAIAGYLASLKKHGEPIPPPITEEIIEVSV